MDRSGKEQGWKNMARQIKGLSQFVQKEPELRPKTGIDQSEAFFMCCRENKKGAGQRLFSPFSVINGSCRVFLETLLNH
ncbi:hypothetical protein [Desulfospira joergensenii]|uniref:hypothetical protein n=1 Tax=Desulfospira joergensenii TaxID=53329 RepID=UPI00129484D5|nr:hypothetical protein [Desulfospira joergensenii]